MGRAQEKAIAKLATQFAKTRRTFCGGCRLASGWAARWIGLPKCVANNSKSTFFACFLCHSISLTFECRHGPQACCDSASVLLPSRRRCPPFLGSLGIAWSLLFCLEMACRCQHEPLKDSPCETVVGKQLWQKSAVGSKESVWPRAKQSQRLNVRLPCQGL